jgi:hypothetical protein
LHGKCFWFLIKLRKITDLQKDNTERLLTIEGSFCTG